MRHRISAAGIVLRGDELLLVRHCHPGRYDFWLPPGGGLEGEENIFEGAEREVYEETGLIVRARRLLYLQEILEPGQRICKSFVLCQEVSGQLSLDHRVDDERDFLAEAQFFPVGGLAGLDVRPSFFRDTFWQDREASFPAFRYLGLHHATGG